VHSKTFARLFLGRDSSYIIALRGFQIIGVPGMPTFLDPAL